jgi:autotransporter-associated beta strand protein
VGNTATVTLNNGGIEGFLATDSNVTTLLGGAGLVYRTIGSGVSFVISGNNTLGQNVFAGLSGLDNGASPSNLYNPPNATPSGVLLEVKGAISGTGGLSKVSAETVMLSGANTYTGGTAVRGGWLRMGAKDVMPSSGAVVTAGNGVLDLNGFDQTIGALSSGATGLTAALTSPLGAGFVSNSATVLSRLSAGKGDGSSVYGGLVQGNVALTKVGSGVLTLTNANTYVGGTVVEAGKLEGLAQAQGSPFGTGNVEMKGGTLQVTGIAGAETNTVVPELRVAAPSVVAVDATAAADKTRLTLGVLRQTGGMLTLVSTTGPLGGLSTRERVTVTDTTGLMSGGVIPWIFAQTSPVDPTLNIVALSGSDVVCLTVGTDINLVPAGNPFIATTATVNTLAAGVSLSALQLNATTVDGPFTLGVMAGEQAALVLNSGSTVSTTVLDFGTSRGRIVGGGVSGSTISASVRGSAGVVVEGSQAVTLSGTNLFTGGLAIRGLALVDSEAAMGSGSVALGSGGGVASLGLTADFTTTKALSVESAWGVDLRVSSGRVAGWDGVVSGSAGVTKRDAGTLVLGGVNTFTGTMTVAEGALRVASASALGAVTAGTTVESGAALEIAAGLELAAEPLTIAGSGVAGGGAIRGLGDATLTGPVTLSGAATVLSTAGRLTFASGASVTGENRVLSVGGTGDVSLLGVVNLGSGSISQASTGTLKLAGANVFSGGVDLSGGVLEFGTGTLGSGQVRVSGTSTLRWATGNVSDVSGSVVAADGSVLTVDTNGNDVVMGSGLGLGGTGGRDEGGSGRADAFCAEHVLGRVYVTRRVGIGGRFGGFWDGDCDVGGWRFECVGWSVGAVDGERIGGR